MIDGKNDEVQARRVLQQELAVLISHAFHSPKTIPDFTKAGAEHSSKNKRDKKSDAQAVEQLRASLMSLHFHNQRGA
ncbi:MAG: hypothetical protein VX940_07280 [Pseudomonadota bacterium]|nr:hypothetical protein [Pseudomonadota bacterium]